MTEISHTSIYYQNFNGIISKLNDIRRHLYIGEYDIICGTESKLDGKFFDSELCPSDSLYVVHRKDRNLSLTGRLGGGGCIVLTKKVLKVKRRYDLESLETIEELWLSVDLGNGYELLICTVYLSPTTTLKDYLEFFEKVTSIKSSLDDKTHLMVEGDFNISMQWQVVNDVFTPIVFEGRIAECFIQFLECNDMIQLNRTLNNLGNILDFVLTDLPDSCVEVTAADPMCKVDRHHPPLSIDVKFKPKKFAIDYDIREYNYRKGNYERINDEISVINWEHLLLAVDPNTATERFYSALKNIIDRNVPLRRRRSHKHPIWFTPELINLLRRKDAAHKRYRRSRNSHDYVLFSRLRRESKALLKKCEWSYLSNLQELSRTEVKPFWSYAKSLRKTNSLPSEIYWNDQKYKGPNEMCEGFASYFDSVHASDNNMLPPPSHVSPTSDTFNFVPVTTDDVLKILQSLKTDKGVGPDGISNVFLKRSASSLAFPLSLIFHRIVKTSCYPDVWKIGDWTPIHKSGDTSNMTNYRGVAKLSGCNIVIERLMKDQFMCHLKKIIHPSQHGFMSSRSTLTNLTEFVQHASEVVDDTGQLDVVYFDVRKAFDQVPHELFLRKCEASGLSNAATSLMRSYITDRKYQVKLNGVASRFVYPKSGSVMGPPAFLLYFNDVISQLQCDGWTFADDLKRAKSIKSRSDAELLQKDIDTIDLWCLNNGLRMNIDKCRVMTISKKHHPNIFNYTLDGVEIERKNP